MLMQVKGKLEGQVGGMKLDIPAHVSLLIQVVHRPIHDGMLGHHPSRLWLRVLTAVCLWFVPWRLFSTQEATNHENLHKLFGGWQPWV